VLELAFAAAALAGPMACPPPPPPPANPPLPATIGPGPRPPCFTTAAGPLRGPAYVEPGDTARFYVFGENWTGYGTLCFQYDSRPKTCLRPAPLWKVLIKPGAHLYLTVRYADAVQGRLVYVDDTLRTPLATVR
jgi:hypothetical protein